MLCTYVADPALPFGVQLRLRVMAIRSKAFDLPSAIVFIPYRITSGWFILLCLGIISV